MTKEEIIALSGAAFVLETKGCPMLAKAVRDLEGRLRRQADEIKFREERIDELVRSFRDLQEEYEKLMEEREQMLKKSLKVTKITYNDGLFIYRSKTLSQADLSALGFEKGDELRLVIVKTPLAQIIEKK